MNDFDRYDCLICCNRRADLRGHSAAGGPLWALGPIGMVCSTISLYRHLPSSHVEGRNITRPAAGGGLLCRRMLRATCSPFAVSVQAFGSPLA